MPKKIKTTFTPGPWRAHLNCPTAAIPGHSIKKDDDVMLPVTLIWEGATKKSIRQGIGNALLIATAPEMFALIHEAIDADDYGPEDWESWNTRAIALIKKATPPKGK